MNNDKMLYVVRYVNLVTLSHVDNVLDSEYFAIKYAKMFDDEIDKNTEAIIVYKVFGFTREEIEKEGANVLISMHNVQIIEYKDDNR